MHLWGSVGSEDPFILLWIGLSLLAGYLLGSIPVGFLVGKLHGEDIREHGSGNIGTTNVLRLFGARWAVAVLLLDALKGFAACFLASVWFTSPWAPWIVAFSGLAAIAGHNWSLFLRFRGGKGAATTAGVFLFITPAVLAIGLSVVILVCALTRYMSLGVMVGVFVGAVSSWFLQYPVAYRWATVVALAWILWQHRSNMGRLWRGEERKIGERVELKKEVQQDG